jgi:ABC-2 type transport system permease protein
VVELTDDEPRRRRGLEPRRAPGPDGTMTEVPMDDLVEIGVFARGEGDGLGEPLHLEPHRIESGKQTITLRVPRTPFRAGLDPYGKLIERGRADNVSALREKQE